MEPISMNPNNPLATFKFFPLTVEDDRPVMLICPGGGYNHVSARENEQVAMQFLAKGYHAGVLTYSVASFSYPTQLLELAKSVKWLRDHAKEYHINPEKVFVMGFSAGGHLTGSLAVHWDKDVIKENLGIENEYVKPNAVVLCYPVISGGEFAHRGSFTILTGGDDSLLDFLSLEKQVGAHVPPVFLWHTVTDGAVPVENSLLFSMALKKAQIPFEMHLYDRGKHGLSLCNKLSNVTNEEGLTDPHVATWLNLAMEWLERL
jgi:acetyl esterase/lipase